jgi:aminoglycoside N3'-acetyltransferase
MVNKEQIRVGIATLQLDRRCVCVHASLRSFGQVEGGAEAVIEAFLESGCTLLVPTFTESNTVPPPPGYRLRQNGSGWYSGEVPPPPTSHSSIFTPQDNGVDGSMGILPKTLLKYPERVRGNHPHSSFAALGLHAQALVGGQHRLDFLAPLRALIEYQGTVLLMGVGLQRMTLIHLAEKQAGRKPFRRHVLDRDGQPVEVEVGTCSKGFGQFDPYLLPLARSTYVGSSLWRAFDPAEVLRESEAAIRRFPRITHCGNDECERCNDGVMGGPVG